MYIILHVSYVACYSSDPTQCHSDTVTGLGVCQRLRLFATCSNDCTIRLWNEDNLLIRWAKHSPCIDMW